LTGWPATARSWFEVSSSPSFPCRERREKEAQQQRQGDRDGRQVKAGRNSGNPLIKGELQNSGNPIRPCTFIDGKSSKGGDAVWCAQRHSYGVLATYRNQVIDLSPQSPCISLLLPSHSEFRPRLSAESSLAFSRPGDAWIMVNVGSVAVVHVALASIACQGLISFAAFLSLLDQHLC
jgi:hypothetical protein